jgi:hypothetical protein
MTGTRDMAPLTDLRHNPVTVHVRDGDLSYNICAERGKAGKVWLTCQCAASRSDGWCRHRLDLLCQRYETVQGADRETREAFEKIITGTPMSDAGQNADRALNAFDDCLQIFDDRRPPRIVGRDLGKFTDLVSDLAACSSELEDALGTLRRLLERD